MGNSIRQFTLTVQIRNRILSHQRQHLAEYPNYLPPWKDWGRRVRCYACRQFLGVGSDTISRAFSHNHRVQYHVPCAERKNII